MNNIEFDHADIFDTIDEIKTSFRRLLSIVPAEGMVLVNADEPNCLEVAEDCPAPIVEVGDWITPATAYVTRATARHLGLRAARRHVRGARSSVTSTFATRRWRCPRRRFAGSGRGNSRGTAQLQGHQAAPGSRGEVRGITIIDDFGHHPTAIRETLAGLRHRYAGRGSGRSSSRGPIPPGGPSSSMISQGLWSGGWSFISRVARLEQIAGDQRLDPERVVADIARSANRRSMRPQWTRSSRSSARG